MLFEKLLNGNVLVKPVIQEEKMHSGLLILSSASTKSCIEVEIVELPDKADAYKIGDKVFISKYAGIEYKNFLLINLKDIILTL